MAIIEEGKPLPEHTKLDYDECCAKIILEDLYPNRYKSVTLADKPDLQCKGIGIEVTIANDEKMQEALKLWYTMPYVSEEKKERNKERMQQLGVNYTSGVQIWPGFSPSLSLIKKAIIRKIQKMENGNYKHFNNYELFIFTDTWFTDELVTEAKEFVKSEKISRYFKRIYILSEGSFFHIFDTVKNVHNMITIDTSEQTNRNIRARKLVETEEIKNK